MVHADVIRHHEIMVPDHVDVVPDHVDMARYHPDMIASHPGEVAKLAIVAVDHDRKRLDHEREPWTMPDVARDREIMVPDHVVCGRGLAASTWVGSLSRWS